MDNAKAGASITLCLACNTYSEDAMSANHLPRRIEMREMDRTTSGTPSQLVPILLEAAANSNEELREAALTTVRALAMPLAQHPEQLLSPLLQAATDASKEARTVEPPH